MDLLLLSRVMLNILIRVAICLLFVFLPLQSMDQWFYDHYFRLSGYRHAKSPFILIRINDAKLSRLGSKKSRIYDHLAPSQSKMYSLWHEQFHRRLLSVIRADKPRMVVFTSFYDSVDNPSAPPLDDKELLFSAVLNEENKLIPPPSLLTPNQNYGFSNIFPDPDNTVRRSYLVYSSGSSLALRVYHSLGNESIRRDLLLPMLIDYRGPAGTYPYYDAHEILDEDPEPGTFKDKIVLIGREGNPMLDYETPFGKMSRLEIQANIIHTFLENREINLAPRWATLTIGIVAVLTSVVIILGFPLTLAWFFLLLFSLLTILITLLAFSYLKIWAGVANPIVCILGTHLLMLGFKLSQEEEEQWKIQQEAEYLKEMDQFKNNFISLFSHDLKTPIAKIKAITDRLLNDVSNLSPHITDSLKAIAQTNSELARSISDILKVTKMELMAFEIQKEVIDLNRLVEESVESLRFLAEEKKNEIVLDLEPLFSMEGDAHLLREVVTNLVENAIKYSPNNKTVIVRTHEEENKVWITVTDQGEGIPAEEIPRVTGKFYRGKNTANKTKGSGLGLYLANYFVELHKGKLQISSEIGHGTAVSFWLPINS
ncbi:MAG: CHASE2 domain-containing protein [Deltaproteobacteria bacterium]|nr:CHASE2 domain-containing protein [Deltaproteobacteria bacterium]